MTGLVVRYVGIVKYPDAPEISASRDGVVISGSWPSFSSKETVEDVKALLDHAFRQHRAIQFAKSSVVMRLDPDRLPFKDDPPCVIEYRRYHFARDEYEVLEAKQAHPRPEPRPLYTGRGNVDPGGGLDE